MYLTYSSLNLKAQSKPHNVCNKLVKSFIIGILLLLIVFFAYIFISTVDHSGLSDKEKLTLSIIHSISAFASISAAIVLCVYIRFHMSKRMQSEDDEEKGEKKSEKNINKDDEFTSYEEIEGKSSLYSFDGDDESWKALIYYPDAVHHV